jgi:5-methyltetrahydrofolate--homocysteine methyltransferase
VIVGGAPVTAEFAHEIGADGYAADAGSAAEIIKAALS